MGQLIDSHNRHIHKLRVSLTDACDFRCFYCMPKDVRFQPRSNLLTADEIVTICSTLVGFGIDEIRITGGEPLVRWDFDEIVSALAELPLKKFGITTNAYKLREKLPLLKEAGCRHLNISLDSLQKDKFNKITRTQTFADVYRNICEAKEQGFDLKVNMIVFRGINDDEILDFVDFASQYEIEVRFLEFIRIGVKAQEHGQYFISADEILEKIRKHNSLTLRETAIDSTSFVYETDTGARIGFVASESRPFCGTCSRLRLSATGKLLACLMSDKGLSLKDVPQEDYPKFLSQVLKMKPSDRIVQYERPMYQIGG